MFRGCTFCGNASPTIWCPFGERRISTAARSRASGAARSPRGSAAALAPRARRQGGGGGEGGQGGTRGGGGGVDRAVRETAGRVRLDRRPGQRPVLAEAVDE